MAVSKIKDRRFKREKKKRVTRTEEYLVNIKYLGDEPTYDGRVLTDLELTKAYTWYSYMCRASDARDYIVEYMEKIGKKNVARLIKSVPDARVPVTAGWLCRILSLGGQIPDRSKEFLLDRVTRAIERAQSDEQEQAKEKPERQPVDVQANVREKARTIIGNLEEMLDNKQPFSSYEYLQKNSIPAIYADYIYDYYNKILGELKEVLAGEDEQLNEAYRSYTKPRVKRLIEFYQSVVDGAEKYSDNAKRIRKANRKPRTVSVEKLLKNLKFKKNDQEYKLVSVDPQTILAAQELWTFNTKNRMLTVYRAQDAGGLGIKTVSVTGFNTTTSICKKLRNPEAVLQNVLTGGKPTLRGIMDNLTTKPGYFSPRITADTVLLRVVK